MHLNKNHKKASPCQLTYLQYISEFSTDIQHIEGRENIVADTSSRIEEISLIDYDKVADEQNMDEEFQNLKTSAISLNFKQYTLPSGKSLWCETSTNNIRACIPESYSMKIFHELLNVSHHGIKSSVKHLLSKFIWPGIYKDAQLWIRSCIACQNSKINRHSKSSFDNFQLPSEGFCDIHIDLIGPLPPSNENIYCLTCIDWYSNWMEAMST